MALDQRQQVYELIEKRNNILILLPVLLNGDAIGAGLALASTLRKMSKNVTVVSEGQVLSQYNFLPNTDSIKNKITGSRDFIISVDTKKRPISELRYENEDDKLKIFLTPEAENLEIENIDLRQGSFNFDLLLVLNCSDLESLGGIYEKNTELFFEVPIINIDNHTSNEQFGEVNMVEITAAATSEIIYYLIEEWGKDLLDEDSATHLLSGIVSATNSFQKNNTTPRAFSVAASLINKKARHQEIIRYLYKTKSLEILQLWGRIMARLKHDLRDKIIWSILSKEDFDATNTNPQSLAITLDELALNIPYDTNAILILYQALDGSTSTGLEFRGVIQWISRDKSKKDKLAGILNGTVKNNRIHFALEEDSLSKAEESVIQKIKEVIR